jgi:hypothetical protein
LGPLFEVSAKIWNRVVVHSSHRQSIFGTE